MSPQTFQVTITAGGQRAIDVLAETTALPKLRLKDALAKGAVWLQRGKSEQRLRRATKTLLVGDRLSLHYDPALLQLAPPAPTLIADERDYSVWYKPAGMLAQGTQFGDHCALLRWSETAFTPARTGFLVHRLDREAEGLMVIAHSPRAARALSLLWQQSEKQLQKIYAVTVEGVVGAIGSTQSIEAPLDGKASRSDIAVVAVDAEKSRTTLRVNLITGRKHQIRRHLAGIGFPVVGDYRYGKGGEPLQLRATELLFRCPLTQRQRSYSINPAIADLAAK
jgi:tRNA pseudouridine32 synthase/23S rRNA pseudouridine746 synthase